MSDQKSCGKILVIESEAEWMVLLQEAIETTGMKTLQAHSMAEAERILKSQTVFLILSNLVLTDGDGISFCDKLRRERNEIPFVIMAVKADRQRASEGIESGVSEVFDKPFNADAVQNLCRRFAQKRLLELEQEEREAASLLTTFLDETREQLVGVDDALLHLEKNPDSRAEIDHLFRKIHTIKGSSGSVKKAEVLTPLAHALESLLSLIKEGRLQVDGALIDIFFTGTDLLSVQVKAIEGLCPFPPVDSFIVRLKEIAAEAQGRPIVKAQPKEIATAPESAEARTDLETDNGVYVPTEKLDSFLEMAGDLIALKNAFYMLMSEQGFISDMAMPMARDIGQTLDKVADRIQNQLMEVRRVALKKVYSKLPRIMRQVSSELQKDVALELLGEEVSVDKSIANVLSGCLCHAVRNSMDHGLETTAERKLSGKPLRGRVTVRAEIDSDAIRIWVEDDGKGINRERVLAKALSLGLLDENEAPRLSDAEVFSFIFRSGFSTAAQVSNISGRGVGMDAIYTAIAGLGGETQIFSQPGQGTSLLLTIPVLKTINVEKSILLESAGVFYAMPLKNVSTIRTLYPRDLTPVKQMLSFQFRGRATRVAPYRELCQARSGGELKPDFKEQLVVVISSKEEHFGLLVDRVVCQFDAIVRPFSLMMKKARGFDGTAIVGNGKLAYFVNADEMVRLAHDQNLKSA